jgi:hypothetical protein
MPLTIDQLDEVHARIALDILEADANQPVYEGKAPDNVQTPYILVYSHVYWPGNGSEGQNLDMVTNQCTTEWIVHCAGETDQAARALGNRVRQLLVNVKPVIANRSCSRIQQETSLNPIRDERTGVLVMDVVATYQFSSNG